LLAGKGVEGGGGCGGGILKGGMRRDVVVGVNRKKSSLSFVLCSARCAVNTWITPQGWKRKAILNQIEDGEQTAMVGRTRCARLRVQPNPSRAEASRRLETDRDQERYLDTVEFSSGFHGVALTNGRCSEDALGERQIIKTESC